MSDPDVVQRDAGRPIEEDLVELLSALVRCPSVGPGEGTDRALGILVSFLAAADVSTNVLRAANGVATLVASVRGERPGPNLLLIGHVDVVPIDEGWAEDPFLARVDEMGVMHGRGTVDMKAGLTAFASTLATIRRRGGRGGGSVTMLVDCDEETGSEEGLLPYISEFGLQEFDWAICGEPTGLRPYLGNRGLIWSSIRIGGMAAHAGMPDQGVNPVPILAELICALPQPTGAPGPFGARGPSLSPTVVRAGRVRNSIPDNATVAIDRRVVPGEDIATIVKNLREIAVSVADPHSADIRVTIEKVWPPCLMDQGALLARLAAESTVEAGFDGTFGFDDACNDASFTHEAGVPTLIWGPGDPDLAHSSQERVRLSDVESARDLYVRVVTELCGGAP